VIIAPNFSWIRSCIVARGQITSKCGLPRTCWVMGLLTGTLWLWVKRSGGGRFITGWHSYSTCCFESFPRPKRHAYVVSNYIPELRNSTRPNGVRLVKKIGSAPKKWMRENFISHILTYEAVYSGSNRPPPRQKQISLLVFWLFHFFRPLRFAGQRKLDNIMWNGRITAVWVSRHISFRSLFTDGLCRSGCPSSRHHLLSQRIGIFFSQIFYVGLAVTCVISKGI